MSIPSDDRGLLLADGLFETLLWRDGGPVDFHTHADRLRRGCAALGLPAPTAAQLTDAVAAVVGAAPAEGSAFAVRLTWTAGSGGRGLGRPAEPSPRLVAAAFPAPEREGPARLATSSIRRNPHSPTSRLKTLAYLDNVMARREALAAGADEALMLNTRGEVACAAAANLFWIEEDRLMTPALDVGVLDGVTRGRVLAAASAVGLRAEECAVPAERLASATGMFLTNSLIGVRPVGSLDGRPVSPHPAVARLAAAAGV